MVQLPRGTFQVNSPEAESLGVMSITDFEATAEPAGPSERFGLRKAGTFGWDE